MPHPTRVLLWTDTPGAYVEAIDAAGLAERVAVDTLPRKDTPTQAQRADTEAMLAWGAPPGLLPQMAALRWVQALTAGVESWMALPDLPPCPHPDLRARHPSRVDAGEHPRRAVPSHQAVCGDRRGPEAAPLDPPHGDAAERPDAGHPGAGRDRPGGRAARHRAAHAGDRHQAAPGAAVPHVAEVFSPDRTDEVLAQSDFVLLLLPATPETENFINAERLAKMKPTAWLLNFGRGHLIADADLIAAVQAEADRRRGAGRVPPGAAAGGSSVLGNRRHPGAAAYRRRPSDPRQDRGAAVRGEPGAVPGWADAEGGGGPGSGVSTGREPWGMVLSLRARGETIESTAAAAYTPLCHGRRRPATHDFAVWGEEKDVDGRPAPAMTRSFAAWQSAHLFVTGR